MKRAGYLFRSTLFGFIISTGLCLWAGDLWGGGYHLADAFLLMLVFPVGGAATGLLFCAIGRSWPAPLEREASRIVGGLLGSIFGIAAFIERCLNPTLWRLRHLETGGVMALLFQIPFLISFVVFTAVYFAVVRRNPPERQEASSKGDSPAEKEERS
jgi:hypothetical protein